jgi:hypothetical protein
MYQPVLKLAVFHIGVLPCAQDSRKEIRMVISGLRHSHVTPQRLDAGKNGKQDEDIVAETARNDW